jgi:hypothetical protein
MPMVINIKGAAPVWNSPPYYRWFFALKTMCKVRCKNLIFLTICTLYDERLSIADERII